MRSRRGQISWCKRHGQHFSRNAWKERCRSMLPLSTLSNRLELPLATQMSRRWCTNSWPKSKLMLTYFRLLARVRKSMMISKAKMNKRSKDSRSYVLLMITGKSSKSQTLQMRESLRLSECKCKLFRNRRMGKKTMRLNSQNWPQSWRDWMSNYNPCSRAKRKYNLSMIK